MARCGCRRLRILSGNQKVEGASVTEVVVIGAGPYGLSVAAHLRAANVPFRIFGKPMHLWAQHMPKGLTLKSDGFASNLSAPGNPFTLRDYCHDTGQPYADIGWRTPLDTIIGYGIAFQQRQVGPIEPNDVTRIEKRDDRFVVSLDSGVSFTANRVVVATGPLAYRYVPDFGIPQQMVSHASDLSDLALFAGRRVAVVGGGQSATESAALLNEAGAQVSLISRRPIFWFNPELEKPVDTVWRRIRSPNFGLGPGWRTWFWSEQPAAFHRLPDSIRAAKAYDTFGPAGSGWIKHRVVGRMPIYAGALSFQESNGRVHVAVDSGDGRKRFSVDQVIAATGYRTDINKLDFLRALVPQIDTLLGAPRLARGFESSVAGLHFVGYAAAPSFGPSMRFIYGTWYAAREVARAAMLRRTARETSFVQERQPA